MYGRIVDVPGNYDPVTREYTGLWDGTFKQAWTDNGAWCVFDMLRSTRYGLGAELDPARVEAAKWALYSIARFNDEPVEDGTEAAGGTPNTEPRYRFSGAVAAEADAAQVIAGMLSNFRAGFYGADGALEPVQDSHKVFPASDEAAVPREAVALLGPANVVDGAFEYAAVDSHRGRASAVAVAFADPARGSRPGIEAVVDEALVARYGYRRTDVAALYCTSRAQAHRLGPAPATGASSLSRPSVRYRAGLDQGAVRPGDLVRIADPAVAGQRMAGRILEATGLDADTVTCRGRHRPRAHRGGGRSQLVQPPRRAERRAGRGRSVHRHRHRAVPRSVPHELHPPAAEPHGHGRLRRLVRRRRRRARQVGVPGVRRLARGTAHRPHSSSRAARAS